MRVSRCLLVLLAAALAGSRPAPARTPPTGPSNLSPQWFGTWQLDRSRSHLVGASITIGRIPHGYHFDFGAVSFNVSDDGRDTTTLGDRTTSIKPLTPNSWYRVHKVAGNEVDHSTLTLAGDSRTLHIHTIATALDGIPQASDESMTRIGPGAGLAGTWRSTNPGVNVTALITIEAAGSGRLTWIFPDQGQRYTVATDAVPVTEIGPGVPATATIAFRRVSDHELQWTERLRGQPFTEGIDRLAADGLTLEETTWPSHTPADRQVAVYTRR